MILLDSDHLTVAVNKRHSQYAGLHERIESTDDEEFSTTFVSVEEQCRGWLARINSVPDVLNQVSAYRRLAAFFIFLRDWDIVPLDKDCATEFMRLRKSRIRIGTNDLKIAAIAISNSALLLSANLRYFQRVPGLRVENWLE